jgi:nicotinamidase-related amidase
MKVLVVVDMQNDFITGSLGTPEAQAIVPNVKKKIEEAVKNGDLIIFTRDTHYENYLETREGKNLPVEHCIRGTNGWNIHQELLDVAGDDFLIVDKFTFGSKSLPSIIHSLISTTYRNDRITGIELVGLCTDICVVSNALLLKSYFYESYKISVDATCCAGVTPETHEAALKTMEMCQINVKR